MHYEPQLIFAYPPPKSFQSTARIFGVISLETRTEGNKRSWDALKSACKVSDLATVNNILNNARMRLIGNSVQLTYDQDGYKYDLPVFVINEPDSFEFDHSSKENIEIKEIKVK